MMRRNNAIPEFMPARSMSCAGDIAWARGNLKNNTLNKEPAR